MLFDLWWKLLKNTEWCWAAACSATMSRHWRRNWRGERPVTTMTCAYKHLKFLEYVSLVGGYWVIIKKLLFPFHHVRKVYEERLANYRKTFESHKEHYCKYPLAQKLLTLQAQKEEIESRIKVCDDEISMKQKELDRLTGNKLYESLFTWKIMPPTFIHELFLCPAKYSPTAEDLQHRYLSVKFWKSSRTVFFVCFLYES